jgi:uncharacterized phage protein (TIGR01671 family)
MKIEIKFRALTKNNNVMVFGDLILCPNGEHRIIWFELKGEMPSDVDYNDFNEVVQSTTIGQFTGLKDEVGVEIYEGDVLSEKWRAEVYKNNEGTYMVRFYTNPKGNKPQSLFSYLKKREKAGTSDRDCIKIGNIYQNPELLSIPTAVL